MHLNFEICKLVDCCCEVFEFGFEFGNGFGFEFGFGFGFEFWIWIWIWFLQVKINEFCIKDFFGANEVNIKKKKLF